MAERRYLSLSRPVIHIHIFALSDACFVWRCLTFLRRKRHSESVTKIYAICIYFINKHFVMYILKNISFHIVTWGLIIFKAGLCQKSENLASTAWLLHNKKYINILFLSYELLITLRLLNADCSIYNISEIYEKNVLFNCIFAMQKESNVILSTSNV